MRNLLFIIFILIFCSCASNKENEATLEETTELSEAVELHGEYRIKQIKNRNITSEELILKFDTIQNEVSGNAGCNRFSSSFQQNSGKVTFKDPVSTKMYCEGKMETEEEIINILPEISEFTKDKEDLIFYSEASERLLTIEKQN